MAKSDMSQSFKIHSNKEKPIRNKTSKFTKKEVHLSDTPLFFPEGFEKIFLVFYFTSLPYIAGLLFQYFYISDGNVEIFLSINKKSSFILTWAIGYEIIATLILLYIMKMAIAFANASRKVNIQEFRRP